MERPKKSAGLRICLALTSDLGLTVYGNREAFKSLRQQLEWLEHAPDAEYYECHVLSLEGDASLFDGRRPRNVWTLLAAELKETFLLRSENCPGFDLNFMRVPEAALDEMAAYQESGTLPEDWVGGLDRQSE